MTSILRRDLPLAGGDTLRIRATVWFDLDVGDWLDGKQSVTVAEITTEIGRRKDGWCSDEELFAFAMKELRDSLVVGADFVTEVEDSIGSTEVAFESWHEQRDREAGKPPRYGREYVDGGTS